MPRSKKPRQNIHKAGVPFPHDLQPRCVKDASEVQGNFLRPNVKWVKAELKDRRWEIEELQREINKFPINSHAKEFCNLLNSFMIRGRYDERGRRDAPVKGFMKFIEENKKLLIEKKMILYAMKTAMTYMKHDLMNTEQYAKIFDILLVPTDMD